MKGARHDRVVVDEMTTGGIPGNNTGGTVRSRAARGKSEFQGMSSIERAIKEDEIQNPFRATRGNNMSSTDAFGIPLRERRILDEKRAAEEIVLEDFVRWMTEKAMIKAHKRVDDELLGDLKNWRPTGLIQ